MRSFFRTAPAAALLILASSAFAQPDWYAHREERWRDEHSWRARLFTEVREDLDHVQSATPAFRVGDEFRLVKTKQELGELQSDLDGRRYNAAKLDGVIATLQKVVADNRMPSARGFDSPDTVRPIRIQSEPESAPFMPTEPVVRVSAYSQAAETPETDELDIPAFLRRGH